MLSLILIAITSLSLAALIAIFIALRSQQLSTQRLEQQLRIQQADWQQWLGRSEARAEADQEIRENLLKLLRENQSEQQLGRQKFDEHQIKSLKLLQE